MADVSQRVICLFDDLISQGEKIKKACKTMYFSGGKRAIDAQAFEAWRTSCLTLLRSTFGTSSPHYDSFINLKFFDHYNSTLLYLGILQGARDDLSKGYFYHKDLMLSVNIFNTFLADSLDFHRRGQVTKALGLLESVLRGALRKLSDAHGIAAEQPFDEKRTAATLARAHVIPAEVEAGIAKVCDYLRDAGDKDGGRDGFVECQSWTQRFLYEFLGSRIVIVN